MKDREMLPLDPNEFMLIHDGITISTEFENEIKRDGNKFAAVFGDGVGLMGMVEQGLILPVGRCPKTRELIYQATEKGLAYVETQKALRQKSFSTGLAERISNKIKSLVQ